MEEKNQENQELQDIILENDDENPNGKAKKIITTIISLIILFLIIVVVVKFLNTNDEEEPAPSQNIAGVLMLPDEQTAPMPENFEQMPIVTEPPQTINQALELKDEPRAELITPKEPEKPELAPKAEVKEPAAEPKKPEPKKPEIKKPEPKKPEPAVIKPEPKKPALEKELTKPEIKANTASAMAGSYVQVSSVAKLDPKSSLIKKLNSSGYEYKTYETTVNGKKVIKLLIGPFSGAELKQKLAQIKADIDQKAYIYTIK